MAELRTLFMLCGVLVYFASFVNGAVSLEDATSRQYQPQRVAFVAELTTVGTSNGQGVAVPRNKIIVFNRCKLNIGGGYNRYNGKFTVPVSGVYKLSTHVCNGQGKHFVAGIMKGSTEIAITTVFSGGSTVCGSVDTIARLVKGDVVTVQSRFAYSRMFSNQHRWQSFTGYLLFKLW